MFDSKQTLTNRLADATDLLIDFATLGEYGLEPVGRAAPSCETRRRAAAAVPTTGTSERRRPGAPIGKADPRRRHPVEGPFLLRP